MNKNTLYDLKEMLCKELDEIAKKGEMSAGDLETCISLLIPSRTLKKSCTSTTTVIRWTAIGDHPAHMPVMECEWTTEA